MTTLKRYLFSVCVVLGSTLSSGWAQSTSEDQVWSLEDCLEYALENNPVVRISALGLDIADAQVGQTRAQGLPQINGAIGYTNNPAVQVNLVPDFLTPVIIQSQADLGAIPQPVADSLIGLPRDPLQFQLGQAHNGQASITLTQLLFDGSYFVGLQAARTYRELSQHDLQASRQDVIENVTKAYYGVLVNQERLILLQENLNRLNKLLDETSKLYEEGFVPKVDVSRLRVSRNNIQTEYNKVKNLAMLGEQLLKFQMGMPVEESLRVEADLRDIDWAGQALPLDEEVVFNNRIEYRINQTNQRLAELDLKNVRAGYLPKLSLQAQGGANNQRGEFSELFTEEWFGFASISVGLNIPIFDGLLKANMAQEKKIQAEQLKIQQEMLENNISLEVSNARVILENAVASLEVQQENMELAQEVFDLVRVKYKEGVSSNLELVDADNGLKEAQTNYYSAVYEALIALVDLEAALGMIE